MTLRKSVALILLAIALGGGAAFVAYVYHQSQTPPQTTHSRPSTFLGLPIAKTIEKAASLIDAKDASAGKDFSTVWLTDYSGNRVIEVGHDGKIIWQQTFSFPSVQDSGQASNVEFMTVAPNGDLMVTTANGMLVQEINRTSHEVVWQYGVLNQQYCNKCLHQPKKAYLISDGNEVLVTDANNRRVIIIDKATKQIIWQYGHTAEMKDAPGYLKGNRFAMPINGGEQVLISDTLTKRVMIVDRATKNILWQWEKPDSKWLQNVSPTTAGTFVIEDHLKNEVFEIDKEGKTLWTLHQLSNGKNLSYPTDAIKLGNGNVLIAEGGKSRIIEVEPVTGNVVWEYKGAGLPTSIAVEY